ncbi:hypothetical protein [Peribacillus muralis]|uniref:hypothetical protein n=1 Tax=Peribacillus muralis TaxID=264697 RepID=UPI003CFF1A2D
MKYRFVTKLYNLQLNNILRKGKRVGRGRISNSFDNFKSIFDNQVFIKGFGSVEFNEFEDGVYYYEVGEVKDLRDKFDKEPNHIDYLNYLMSKVRLFQYALWMVKDNSVNTELGFLQIYTNEPADGTLTNNGLFDNCTTSEGDYKAEIFNPNEIEKAIEYLQYIKDPNTTNLETAKKMILTSNPLSKENGRPGRAFHFLSTARSEATLPIKAIYYSTILECLFTSDSSEVTHKVSERFAHYLGDNFQERMGYYHLAKNIYKIRSKAVHGQAVKDKPEEMKVVLKGIDAAIRTIFIGWVMSDEKYSVFGLKNEEFDKWFTELILK